MKPSVLIREIRGFQNATADAYFMAWPDRDGWVPKAQDASSSTFDRIERFKLNRIRMMKHLVASQHSAILLCHTLLSRTFWLPVVFATSVDLLAQWVIGGIFEPIYEFKKLFATNI